jgi:hypothetical protein
VGFGAMRPEVLRRWLAATNRGARLGPVDDHAVAIHPSQVQSRLRDQHRRGPALDRVGRRCLVVAGGDQDPVARMSCVDGGLHGLELPGDAVVGADEQHSRARGGRECETATHHQDDSDRTTHSSPSDGPGAARSYMFGSRSNATPAISTWSPDWKPCASRAPITPIPLSLRSRWARASSLSRS